MIACAIIEAYIVATIKERSPEVHLFLTIAPDRVDVNVHPTKAEVRFLEGSLVHQVLRRALGDALGEGRAPELQLSAVLQPTLPAEPRPMSIPGVLAGAQVGNRWAEFSSQSPIPSTQVPSSNFQAPTSGSVDIRPMTPLGQF